MAEGFLRRYAGNRIETHSARLESDRIHPLTRQMIREAGYALEEQFSIDLTACLGAMSFDFAITRCREAVTRCPRPFPGEGVRLRSAVPDPAAVEGDEATRLVAFRAVRDEVEARVLNWIEELGLTAERARPGLTPARTVPRAISVARDAGDR